MAKNFGKVILFGVVVGAAAAGIYHVLQNKNNETDDFDDFDDFDDLDDFDDIEEAEEAPAKKKGYVSLDSAKAFVSGTVDKAKDAFSKVQQKIQKSSEEAVEDIASEDVVAEEIVVNEEIAEEIADATDSASEVSDKTTEEFFDDDEA